MDSNLALANKFIQDAEVLVFTSGAGMGVDSGIGTFRGKNAGLWPPLKDLNLTNQKMAVPLWFEDNKNPYLAFGFWQARYNEFVNNLPHKGYYLLQELIKNKNNNNQDKPFFVYTSNIDGHWLASGIPDTNIVEIHGNIRYQQCRDNCTKEIWPCELNCNIDPVSQMALDPLPKCKNCNKSVVRPNVCMFEDYGCNFKRIDEQRANWRNWPFRKHQKITVIEIGAGTAITTIRNLSNSIVNQHPSNRLVRINLEEAMLDGLTNVEQGVSIQLTALEALADLVALKN